MSAEPQVVLGNRKFEFGETHEKQFRDEGGTNGTIEEKEQYVDWLRSQIIGELKEFQTPFGERKVVYCDYTASGRGLKYIENYIQEEVLPWYGNTHTTTSVTGRQSTFYRHEARQLIKQLCHATEDDSLIFCGSGSTSAVHKLISILNLENIPKEDIVVFLGPYEHHSNMLPWRELGAKVVMIGEKQDGTVNIEELESKLKEEKDKILKIGSFSAASNVTGIVSDDIKITSILHEYGAFSFWDYATAGGYIKIDMNPIISQGKSSEKEINIAKDAIFISPHKLIGGIQSPGILIMKKKLCKRFIPKQCGGGSVFFVSREDQVYLSTIEEREEAGTPEIVGSIRASLAFQLKGYLLDFIESREVYFHKKAHEYFSKNENICLLGPNVSHENSESVKQLPIFSFLIKHKTSGLFLHFNFVATLLNDLFGIQVRGGCVCSGPYSQELLGIDFDLSKKFEQILLKMSANDSDLNSLLPRERDRFGVGSELLRPGFTRLNFHYTLDDSRFNFILRALNWIANHGWKLLCIYKFHIDTAEWSHFQFSLEKHRKWLKPPTHFFTPTTQSPIGQDTTNPTPKQETQSLDEYFDSCLEKANALLDKEILKYAKNQNFIPSVEDQLSVFDEEQNQLRWFLFPAEAKQFLLRESGLSTVSPASHPPPFSIKKYQSNEKEGKQEEVKSLGSNQSFEEENFMFGEYDDLPEAEEEVKFHIPSKALIHSGIAAIEEFQMINNGDRIIVCVSGGKDSLSMLHLLKHYQFICKSRGIHFDLAAATVDPQTPDTFDPSPLKIYMKNLGLPYFYLSEPIMERAKEEECKSICSYCSRMKRGILYTCARKNGYNVLALGQHLDDLAESFLMSIFHNGLLRTMKANYTIEEGDLRIIRPLVYTRERHLAEFAAEKRLPVITENCPACFEQPKERHRVKQLLATQENLHKRVFTSIRNAMKPLFALNKTGQEAGANSWTASLTEESSILDL